MTNIPFYILIFFLQELFALVVFHFIRRYFQKQNSTITAHSWFYSITKGILERLFIFMGLLNEMPMMIGFFGALKLGTRLDADKNNRVTNDYFLIGNIVSMLIVISSYLIIKQVID
jgi:hypothetical protein